MSEYYYVKPSDRNKTWHLSSNKWITLCGYLAEGSDAWGGRQWVDVGKDPQEPLCKRCIKCREARER